MIKAHKKHLIRKCKERGWSLEEVMDCVLKQDNEIWTIDENHPSYPAQHKKIEEKQPEVKAVPADLGEGVGTELKNMLSTIGISASAGCSCHQRAKAMNDNGLQWCKEHTDTIVSWLEEEAKKRKIPFLKFGAKKLIKFAIKKYEKKESKL